jgi:hypothetical protein
MIFNKDMGMIARQHFGISASQQNEQPSFSALRQA